EPPACREPLRSVDHRAGGVECLTGVVLVHAGGVEVGVLGAVATPAQGVEAAEDVHATSVVELRSYGVDHGDVAAAGRGPEALDGEEPGGCLARGVVAELEGASWVVLDTLGPEGDVRLGVGGQAGCDLVGWRDALELAVGNQSLDVGASTLPAHGIARSRVSSRRRADANAGSVSSPSTRTSGRDLTSWRKVSRPDSHCDRVRAVACTGTPIRRSARSAASSTTSRSAAPMTSTSMSLGARPGSPR